jgi:ABC-type multidrug transport system fused ATPase/permease subunit
MLHNKEFNIFNLLVWLQHATIKENILFGSPFIEKRYKETIRCCALTRDLEILEFGDETEIGEKGVNLSGGQKARISLARAIYSNVTILLLDDPLSAVDAPTAKLLMEEAICGRLVKGRTVILVTHAVSLCMPLVTYFNIGGLCCLCQGRRNKKIGFPTID